MTVSGLRMALLGLAAGDVLGSAVEGRRPTFIDADVLPASDAVTTDDTQQAIVVADHLLRHAEVRPADLATDLVSRAHLYRGVGPGFRRFAAAIADGAEQQEAAQPSAGNGAAMRSAPVALFTWTQPDTMIGMSLAAATVTHADPRGAAAAVAVPAAIHAAARGVTGADLLYEVAEDVTEAEHHLFSDLDIGLAPGDRWHTMSRALRAATADDDGDLTTLASAIGRRASETSASGNPSGTDPYAPASVVTAVAAAAFGEHPVTTLRALVGLGGDTDTMAAIAGAILGVRFEVAEWPWPIPHAERLIELGGALVDRKQLDVDVEELLR